MRWCFRCSSYRGSKVKVKTKNDVPVAVLKCNWLVFGDVSAACAVTKIWTESVFVYCFCIVIDARADGVVAPLVVLSVCTGVRIMRPEVDS